jgi:UDP-N-acetyl-D-mannosaminuronic acid dehydrogenase
MSGERPPFEGDLSGTTISVFGLGKMGLPLAAVLADAGAEVIGVDVDESVVEAVNDGRVPVDEPGLDELVAKHTGRGLTATSDGETAASRANVAIVLVPIVLDDANDPDLGPVLRAAEDVSTGVEAGDLVILESTAPLGTTAGPFRTAVEPAALSASSDFSIAHAPERTSSGRVLEDLTTSYPKIVGGIDERSTRLAASLYRTFNEPGVIEMAGATEAEAVKVFEGIYRDVNIALANELARVCEEAGVDAWSVFEAANTQPYCDIHRPGIGVGGHCIPVYPHFVTDDSGGTPLLQTARSINDSMPERTVARLQSLLTANGVDPAEATVLVLGITYRAGVEETRFAPAMDLIDALEAAGTTVLAHDPLLDDSTIGTTGATPVADPLATGDLDGVVLATGHESYRNLDLESLRDGMRTPILVDGRNVFEESDLTGFHSWTVGRPVASPAE